MVTAIAANASAGAGGIRPQDAAVGCILSLFVCVTVFGNSLVIVAVLREHYLRTITNYFIVSLATADLLMGAVVMPFAVATHVTADYWPFGPVWCDLWHAFDVLSSTASILNLCMIAVERYWAIENPMSYPSKVTKRRCLMMIGAVWICSCLISFPAITWWRAAAPSTQPGEPKERCKFTSDSAYLVCSSIVSFYAPLFVMVFVYFKIYRTATQLVRGWQSGAKVLRGTGMQTSVVLRIHRGGHSEPAAAAGGNNGQQQQHLLDGSMREESCCCEASPNIDGPMADEAATTFSDEDSHSAAARGFARRLRSSFGVRKKLMRFSREQRAAKTLGVVMGVFIACWMPFFVCNIIAALSTGGLGDSEGRVFAVVAWLGYVNSSVNPAIYAHSMRDFRRAFIKLLSCYRRRKRVPGLLNGGAGGGRRRHTAAAATCSISCGCATRSPVSSSAAASRRSRGGSGRRGLVGGGGGGVGGDGRLRLSPYLASRGVADNNSVSSGSGGGSGGGGGGGFGESPSLSPAQTPLRRHWRSARTKQETQALLMRELGGGSTRVAAEAEPVAAAAEVVAVSNSD